jgi:hypothetical protein
VTSARLARPRAAAAALLIAGLAAAAIVWAPISASAIPMTFDVTSTADAGAGSLREAVGFANLNPGDDTITFHLPANSQILPLSNIIIQEALTVDGVDTPGLTIDGGAPLTYQLFLVAPTVAGGSYTFRNLTFDGSVGDPAYFGSMIYVTVGLVTAQALTVDRVVSRNLHTGEGGLVNVFTMGPGGTATVVDSTFTDNTADVNGGSLAFRGIDGQISITRSTFTRGVATTGDGGAVYVDGTGGGTPTVVVTSSTFDANTAVGASGRGGAIYANFLRGLSITDSAFTNGSAFDGGGAVAVFELAAGATTVSILRSSFTGNQSTTNGGAILFGPSAGVVSPGGITVDSSTFAANTLIGRSAVGHSIAFTTINAFGVPGANLATFSVSNSTFDEAGAVAARPWALWLETIAGPASLSVVNSTVIGGIGIASINSPNVTIDHTILWGNDIPGNAFAAVGFTGLAAVTINWSLSSGPAQPYFVAGAGNQFSSPGHGLDPLANNGGPTQTRLPSAASPARNAGNPAFGAVPAFDQRGAGFIRRVGVIDIGAVEAQGAVLSATGGTVSPGLPLGAAFLILTGLALLLLDYRRRYPVVSGA